MSKIYLSPERRPAPHGKYWGMNVYEHDVCVDIAALLASMLTAHGFEVKTADPAKDMAARVKEATAWGANYYMPVHTNANTLGDKEGTARGPLVLAYDHPMSKSACQMAYDCLMEIYPGNGQGVRVNKDFYEIIQTPMLSVYPELAFHDNGEDARWLVSNKEKIALALCRGICMWFGVEWQDSPVTEIPATEPDQEELERVIQERDAARAQVDALKALAEEFVKKVREA